MRVFVLFLLCLFSNDAFGQQVNADKRLSDLITMIKSMKSVSYDYIKTVSFPNGNKDTIKGTLMMDYNNKEMYDDCDAFTTMYAKHWYYAANHRKHTVTVVDVSRENKHSKKGFAEEDVFRSAALAQFLDSVLLKKAIIKKYGRENETITMQLDFKPGVSIKRLEVVYNEQTHMPVSYDMVVMEPWQRTPKGIQSIEARIVCNHFKNSSEAKQLTMDDFFSYAKGKVELKKYRGYKLSVM